MKVATFLWVLFPVLGALAAPTDIFSTNGLSRRSPNLSIGILDLHCTIEKEKKQYPSSEIWSRAPKNAVTLTMTRLGTSLLGLPLCLQASTLVKHEPVRVWRDLGVQDLDYRG